MSNNMYVRKPYRYCWCIEPALVAGTGHFLDHPLVETIRVCRIYNGAWQVGNSPLTKFANSYPLSQGPLAPSYYITCKINI